MIAIVFYVFYKLLHINSALGTIGRFEAAIEGHQTDHLKEMKS